MNLGKEDAGCPGWVMLCLGEDGAGNPGATCLAQAMSSAFPPC